MVQKDTHTPVFTAALFKIAKAWKQTKCLLTDEWIEMWYMYTVEYYLGIKQNEIMPLTTACMGLEIIILSEVRQRKTNTI